MNGVTCRKCKLVTALSLWALAHLHEKLVLVCPGCKTKTNVQVKR